MAPLARKNPVLGLWGQVLVLKGYRGGFCEKLLEASPLSYGVKTSCGIEQLAGAEPISNVGAPLA